jgi:hypothetical protein
MEKIGENNIVENKESEAAWLMKADYLNEYTTVIWSLLASKIDRLREKKPKIVLGFSERYKDQPFNASSEDLDKIKKLDELAISARNLFDNEPFSKKAFMEIAISAAEICNRPERVEEYKKIINTENI